MRKIAYNSQRDNAEFGGRFKAYNQCFSTCAVMFMSHYTPQIAGDDDKFLSKYLYDIEATLNPSGLGARLKLKYKWIKGATSLWWLIQKDAINDYLHHYGVKGNACFYDAQLLIEQLPEFLRLGPVIIGTKRMGGLPGGHIILLVDYDRAKHEFIVNDPFGNATTNYKDHNGAAVRYPYDWLVPYIQSTADMCTCLRWVL